MTGRNSRGAPDSRPHAIGGLLEQLLDHLGIRERVERNAAIFRWDDVVGPRIAAVSKPVRVQGTTLFVEVTGAAWLMELSMMRRTLLGRLNHDRDHGRIDRIVFLQGSEGMGDK